jgi:hypothetical protein
VFARFGANHAGDYSANTILPDVWERRPMTGEGVRERETGLNCLRSLGIGSECIQLIENGFHSAFKVIERGFQ